MSEWKWIYPHAARGSCVPQCPLFGVCHCGCGETALISPHNQTDDLFVKNMPHVWRNGHIARRRRELGLIVKGSWEVNGVPREKIRNDIIWLRDLYGGISRFELAELMDLTPGTVNNILYSHNPNVSKPVADKVMNFKAKHFRGDRVVRFPTRAERDLYKRATSALVREPRSHDKVSA